MKLKRFMLGTAAIALTAALALPASATCRNCQPPKPGGTIVINGNLSGFLTNKGISSGGGGVLSETTKSAWQAAQITNDNGLQNYSVDMGLVMETAGVAVASGSNVAQSGEVVEGEFNLSLEIKK